ncbi:hypothetical protein D3C76_977070 [compost metagenome]
MLASVALLRFRPRAELPATYRLPSMLVCGASKVRVVFRLSLTLPTSIQPPSFIRMLAPSARLSVPVNEVSPSISMLLRSIRLPTITLPLRRISSTGRLLSEASMASSAEMIEPLLKMLKSPSSLYQGWAPGLSKSLKPMAMAASSARMVPVLTRWLFIPVKLAPSMRMPSASSPLAMMVPWFSMPARSTMSVYAPEPLVVASMAVAPAPVTSIRPRLMTLPTISPPSRLMPLASSPLAMILPPAALSRSPLITEEPEKSTARATSRPPSSFSGAPSA